MPIINTLTAKTNEDLIHLPTARNSIVPSSQPLKNNRTIHSHYSSFFSNSLYGSILLALVVASSNIVFCASFRSSTPSPNKTIRFPKAKFNLPLISPLRILLPFTTTTTTTTSTLMASPTSKNENNLNPLQKLGFQNPIILGSGSFTRKLILKEMKIPFHLMVRSIDEKNMGDRTPGSDASQLVELLAKAKADHLVQGILKVNYKDEIDKNDNDNDNNNDDSTNNQIPALSTDEITSLRLPTESNKDEGWIILTADQVVTHENQILEKPTSLQEAQEFVKGYAKSPPATVGSCFLTHIPTMAQVGGIDTATIHFKPSVADSNSYGNDENGMDLVQALVKEGAPVLKCAGGLMVEHELVKAHIDRIEGTEDSVMGLSKDLVLKLLKEMRDKLAEYKGPSKKRKII